ncbi:MAG: DUF4249 family protein [Bacteroidales bacterium]
MKKPKYNILSKRFANTGFMAVVLVFMLSLVSCEDYFITDAKHLKIPDSKPRLVVYSFISPQDTIIRVHVQRSIPYSMSDDQVEPVGNKARVFISKKGHPASELAYSAKYKCFTIPSNEFSIEPGFYYQLNVESFEGEKASAECYVPEPLYSNLTIDSLYKGYDSYGGSFVILEYRFKAIDNSAENYYSTGAYRKFYYEDWFGGVDTTIMNQFIYNFSIEHGDSYIADKDGKTYRIKANTWRYDYIDYKDATNTASQYFDSIFVYIMQTDRNYYHFHKSYYNYSYYDDDFPFAESVHIYSNIVNGLGVFAGYNRQDIYVPEE